MLPVGEMRIVLPSRGQLEDLEAIEDWGQVHKELQLLLDVPIWHVL